VEVAVTDSVVSSAALPDDFYATVSYRDSANTEQFVLTDAESWVGAGSADPGANLWRFTRQSDGTYKITFRGQETQALRQYRTGGVSWLMAEQYQQDAQFHWFVLQDLSGNIYLRCAAQANQTVSVHENYSQKYLYLNDYNGSRIQQIKVTQILDISRTNADPVTFAAMQTIGGQKYILDANGSLGVNGWAQTRNGDWYYLDQNCRIQTGWVQSPASGLWYYLNEQGIMQTGWVKSPASGLWYYLNEQGVMQTGWVKSPTSGLWYYMGPDGDMQTGWQLVNGVWYYLGTDGVMVSDGWQMINGVWYYFSASGAMHTGWLMDNGTWYYMDPDSGAMVTGGRWIDGTYYWFNQSGAWVN
jgi:glucan-binding YG repeat protein